MMAGTASCHRLAIAGCFCDSYLPSTPPQRPSAQACMRARVCALSRALQGAVVTQCFPTFYYAVHETGHRMGFRHANMYKWVYNLCVACCCRSVQGRMCMRMCMCECRCLGHGVW